MGTVKVIRKLRLLYDVVFTRPDASAVQDGDVLTYVLADDTFYPAAPSGGGGGPPTGAAGGVLGGTYPNPSFAADMATQAELDGHINDATDAHDATAISIVDTGTFYTGTEVEAALQEIGAALGVSASGDAVVQDVTQNGHGLSVGDWVKRSGGAYALAQANNVANAEVYGVVSAVADVNNFSLTTHGLVTGLSGLTADAPHFLSPTSAGDITATPPATAGQISKPVLLALSTTSGVVANMRGMVVGVGGSLVGVGGLYDAFAHLRDEKAANTGGGTFTSGAWRTRDLNTEDDPDGIVVLAGNQFTLDAGTYLIQARAPAYSAVGARHKAKLRNITDSSDDVLGSSAYVGADDQSDAILEREITIASTKTFEIQHQTQTTEATVGFGVQSNFSVTEVYTEVLIWRRKAGGGTGELEWFPMAYAAIANPWADFGSGYYPLEYAKDVNWVYIRGLVLAHTATLTPFDPLPVGYRPSAIAWIKVEQGGGRTLADVGTDGSITFFGGVSTASGWINDRIPL